MPDLPIEVNEGAVLIPPLDWTPDQIARFERAWNELIANGPMEYVRILPADKTMIITNIESNDHA